MRRSRERWPSNGLRRARVYRADAQEIPGGLAADLSGRQDLDDGTGGLGGVNPDLERGERKL